ncbi:tyrosine-type recombinase/integrase [Collinsella intestinalis]|uniref:tyrosine-type recombinase/integrase n=1 Tax=Collinsella intestinalis TaxID=147207 RepID=UPI00195916AC|nr:tyrosine-type recombinase/integrase [Collinsella intestinalis]MBM6943559.1 tyrosine-type recombinase/integrase [Collinsella intestinalis]
MEDFKAHLFDCGFSNHTVESYLYAAKQLENRMRDELSNEALLAHKDWLASRYAAKTVNLRITAVNSYLDFVGYDGIRLKSLRVQQKPYLDNVISQSDYELLRDSLKRDGDLFWHFVVRFLAGTGARISELRQFTVESVYDGHLDLVSKGQKLRRIYIPMSLQQDAAEWLMRSGKVNGYIFTSKGSAPMTARGLSLGLKRCAARYDIDQDVVYPHSFRHRFAKNFIERNPDIAFLADLMGHESLETTRIYLRRTASEQRAAVDATIDW